MEKIKIKKEFKKQLLERFNPENAELKFDFYKITIRCILCKMYSCKECPFGKLETERTRGCVRQIKKIITKQKFYMTEQYIQWGKDYNTEARTQLRYLWNELQKIIEWI